MWSMWRFLLSSLLLPLTCPKGFSPAADCLSKSYVRHVVNVTPFCQPDNLVHLALISITHLAVLSALLSPCPCTVCWHPLVSGMTLCPCPWHFLSRVCVLPRARVRDVCELRYSLLVIVSSHTHTHLRPSCLAYYIDLLTLAVHCLLCLFRPLHFF